MPHLLEGNYKPIPLASWMNRLLLFAANILLLPLAPWPVLSCSCEPPGSPLEELALYDAVFAGQVVEIVEKIEDPEDLTISFELSAVWKGELGMDVSIGTRLWSAGCGYHFELGEQYLVYAYSSEDGTLRTGICSRTMLLAAAANDREQLGEPTSRWQLTSVDPMSWGGVKIIGNSTL